MQKNRKNKNLLHSTFCVLHSRRGQSAIELLVALGVLVFSVSAAIVVAFGNQSVSVDTETNNEALLIAEKNIEDARAVARGEFNTLVSATSGQSIYRAELQVSNETQCRKNVTSTVRWNTAALREQRVDLRTTVADIREAVALGGDCSVDPPDSNWDNPQRFASDTYSPGKPSAIDVLKKIAYLGADKTPFFYIADTNGATQGQTDDLFVDFANGFVMDDIVNALDAAEWRDPITGSSTYYVFAAMDKTSNQLAVIDVTDILNPALVATSTLLNVDPAGSYPQGRKVFYYKNRLYVTTRETTGPEFHIFDVSDPTDPVELGGGAYLNITINDMVVREQLVGGETKRFAYFATSKDDGELLVYDVTDPDDEGEISEVVAARQDLSGDQNGLSVFLLGNNLYFGRQSTPSGPDLYVFDASDPEAGLALLGSKDIGTGVTSIEVAGRYAFLATPKVNKEFQVWNVLDPAQIALIVEYNFGNIVDNGVEYEFDFIYITGDATPNFQILYSPPQT